MINMGNLHLVTGYGGKSHITAEDHGSFNAALLGSESYVLDRGSKFSATAVSSNTIRIHDGDLLLQGRHVRLAENSYIDLTIENGAQGAYRNDLIVARYQKNTSTGVEECSLVVIKGTAAASSPKDPDYIKADILTNHAAQSDFPLYRVPLNGINIGDLVPLFTVIENVPALLSKKSTKYDDRVIHNLMWEGNAVPYVNSIYGDEITPDSVVEISLRHTATESEVKEFQALNLQPGAQYDGRAEIRAFGTKNTAPIPITVVVRSDV
ncbi:MAG: hypothetical protein J6V37_02940 [Clostridia bacterium]|nr:hypothetical protein [Clostridia bacterium]